MPVQMWCRSPSLDPLPLSLNIGAERILGYQEAEIIGQPYSLIFIPQDVVKHQPEYELAASTAPRLPGASGRRQTRGSNSPLAGGYCSCGIRIAALDARISCRARPVNVRGSETDDVPTVQSGRKPAVRDGTGRPMYTDRLRIASASAGFAKRLLFFQLPLVKPINPQERLAVVEAQFLTRNANGCCLSRPVRSAKTDALVHPVSFLGTNGSKWSYTDVSVT
jgi:hypothetical protein